MYQSLFRIFGLDDLLFNTVKQSGYANTLLRRVLMYFICGLIRFHLSILFSTLFYFSPTINFFLDISFNVFLYLSSGIIYSYVESYEDSYQKLVAYFIKNYTYENYIRWKRYLMISVCTYLLIALCIIKVDNWFFIIAIIQYIITFLLCEIIERKIWSNYISDKIKMRKYGGIPKVKSVQPVEINNTFLSKRKSSQEDVHLSSDKLLQSPLLLEQEDSSEEAFPIYENFLN